MAFGRTRGLTLSGVEGRVVTVEAQCSGGLPVFVMSGVADSACRQATDRVRPAIRNLGITLTVGRWTVNLSPAGLPKTGSGLDLAVAAALLVADGHLEGRLVDEVAHLGEVGLDGTIRPVAGTLPMVAAAATAGVREVMVCPESAHEAALVAGIRVLPVRNLEQVREYYQARAAGLEVVLPRPDAAPADPPPAPDLVDVVGQAVARSALEVAAAGGHNLMLVGPPGAGKTMLAQRLPGILPPLGQEDALSVTAIHSVLGLLPSGGVLLRHPPFVAPHHGASMAAVIGGGSGAVRPGAVSRAHRGVLFLDEAPEFRRDVLDGLRQPLESGEVVVARADRHVRLPARFQLVLAANPCPCGGTDGCRCAPLHRSRYLARLSGPLLDRVDIKVAVGAVARADLTSAPGEPSATVAARVRQARARQEERWAGMQWSLNSEAPGSALRQGRWRLRDRDRRPLDEALDLGLITLRGLDRCLRVTSTVH